MASWSAVTCLALVTTVGCASATEEYCSALEEEQQTLQDLAGSTEPGGVDRTLEVFDRLRAQAPDDIIDEWDTVIFSLQTLRDALAETGVDPAELAEGRRPEGVSEAQMRLIENAAERLRSEQVTSAGEGLEQHARDVCGVDLGV